MPRSPRRPATPLPPETSVYLGWSGFYLGLNAGGGIPNVDSIQRARRSRLCVGEQLPFRRDRWRPGRVQLANRHDGRRRRGGFLGKRSERRLERALPGRPLRPGFGGDDNQKVPWFGTARGRLGVAASGWLIYATAGYAYARLETDAFASAGPVAALASFNETRNGWTAGGGIEVAIAPGWSAKVEYLYLDFGHRTNGIVFTGLPAISDDARLTMNVARAGVNYRF
jgi:outer membrane immunogenic protein